MVVKIRKTTNQDETKLIVFYNVQIYFAIKQLILFRLLIKTNRSQWNKKTFIQNW